MFSVLLIQNFPRTGYINRCTEKYSPEKAIGYPYCAFCKETQL